MCRNSITALNVCVVVQLLRLFAFQVSSFVLLSNNRMSWVASSVVEAAAVH
ncbi:MAG: hypothetical protein ACKERG_01265 [Candidatus Hodgkinia cicadicola]